VSEPAETDWAYAAGFVDGEGCIAIARSFVPAKDRYYYGVQVAVANRDRAVLDWMQITWGGWVVPVRTVTGRARSSWSWRCTGLKAKPFLMGIRPWLRMKTPQCDNALAMISVLDRGRRTLGRAPLPTAWREDQERHYWIQRELNHRGSDAFVRKAMHSPRQIHRIRSASL
jgi:hypothetical protein